jgi:hypothetical protein
MDRIGWIDKYGLYQIELPEHHVYMDDRNFFSRYLQGERLRTEKEALVEAFSKLLTIYMITSITNRGSEGNYRGWEPEVRP